MFDVLQGQAVHLDSQELHFFRRVFDAVDYIGIVADHIHIFFVRHVRSLSFYIIKIHLPLLYNSCGPEETQKGLVVCNKSF